MQCSRCEHENREGRRFCTKCGSPLQVTCGSCGFANEPGDAFCGGCGLALPLLASPHDAQFVSPRAYTPRYLADAILTSRVSLEGERKHVTVLFADLKGSMELLADRDPEEARRLLDPVLELMMEAVHRYEGTVNQVMGDGIMALFGAPVAHEDHAVRACYAALRMQEQVGRYGDATQRSHGVPVQIRVGLNSGEVVVRSIGSDLRMDYTAVGQTTHLAGRMEQMAKPGSVLATADTLRLAEDYVRVNALGPVPVKGLDAPVEVYELVGASGIRSRIEAAAARGFTRFVGREAELDAVRHALEPARASRGQIVALVGEPGVGKSRLFWELIHSPHTEGWLVLESSGASYGKATPYLPVIDLLRSYCQIEPRDDARQAREKLAGKVLALDRTLEPLLPAFLALLDVPGDDPAWTRLDPHARRHHTVTALERLLLRESEVQPLCIAIEDLHWIDSETQAFLDSLADSLATARILLLVNYRPEYQHGWERKSYYTELRIDPLVPESAKALLHALMGDDPDLQPLQQRLIGQTRGNPFFLEESARTLVETGVLAGERGAYRLTDPVPTIQVPATVQAVLGARIDRLPAEDKRLLQAAAVLGETVPVTLLQAVVNEPDEVVRQGLAHLRAAEFLYEARLFPDLEYTFKHGLTCQVAYESLLHDRRRALHARIVDAIERSEPDRLTEHAETLAHHAYRGEAWEKAVRYLRQAGSRAAGRAANREAVTYFERALAALARLPADRWVTEAGVDIRLDLRSSLGQLGRHGQISDHLVEAERLAAILEDQRRLGRVYALVSDCFRLLGEHARAIEFGQRALALAGMLADRTLEVTANTFLGMVHQARGAYGDAIELFERNVAVLGEASEGRFEIMEDPAVHSRAWLAACWAEVGEFARGEQAGRDAARLADASERPLNRVCASAGLGRLLLRKGAHGEAIAVLESGYRLSRAFSLDVWTLILASALGVACARVGRTADAIALGEQGLEQDSADTNLSNQPLRLGWLAEAYLLVGRLDEALRTIERASELARRYDQRGHLAWALCLQAEIATAEGPVRSGDAWYQEAIAIAEALDMRPLVARAHLGLGTLAHRRGDTRGAIEHLVTASVLFGRMGMTFWQERSDAARRQATAGAA